MVNEMKLYFAEKYKKSHNKQIESFISAMKVESWPKKEIAEAVSYAYGVQFGWAQSKVIEII